jgi:hypothetical protein
LTDQPSLRAVPSTPELPLNLVGEDPLGLTLEALAPIRMNSDLSVRRARRAHATAGREGPERRTFPKPDDQVSLAPELRRAAALKFDPQ